MGGNVVGRRQLIGLPLAVLGVAACDRVAVERTPGTSPAEDAGQVPTRFGGGDPDGGQPAPGPAPNFPINNRFYSWTTPEQAAELRSTRKLFSREERPGLGPGYLMSELTRLSYRDPAAKAAASLTLGRYAWTHAWSTAAGFLGEEYGSELIEIVVGPNAQFVHFESLRNEVRVVNSLGMEVPLDPARVVGATHFNEVSRGTFGSCGAPGTQVCAPYREVYLGNPAQIASWSLGTAALRDVIAADIAKLRVFAASFPEAPFEDDVTWTRSVLQAMREKVTKPESYVAQLAFGDPAYRDLAPRTRALIAILESRLFEPTSPLVVAG